MDEAEDVLGKIDFVYECNTNVLGHVNEFQWNFPHIHVTAMCTLDQVKRRHFVTDSPQVLYTIVETQPNCLIQS